MQPTLKVFALVMVLSSTYLGDTSAQALPGLDHVFLNVDTLWSSGNAGNLIVNDSRQVSPVIVVDPKHTEERNVYAAARHVGHGRLMALGHEGILLDNASLVKDNMTFLRQTMQWLGNGKKIILKQGWAYLNNMSQLLNTLKFADDYELFLLWGDIDATKLVDQDILIIGNDWNGQEPYTAQELEAIDDFLNSGGGVLLAGLGWSWPGDLDSMPANQIAKMYGFEYGRGTLSNDVHAFVGAPLFYTFYPVKAHKRFTVTNTNQYGPGSLRAALDETYLSTGYDTIDVATTGVISLDSSGSTLLRDFEDITLNGNGIIIDGNQYGRLTDVGGRAKINSLTIRNCYHPYSAGAMWIGPGFISDTIILDCVLFEGNHTDFFNGQGGVLASYNARVRATNCTFSGNAGAFGGAIYQNGGTMIMDHCTLTENATGSDGGAIYTTEGTLILNGNIIANSFPADIEDIYNEPTTSAHSRGIASNITNTNNLVEICAGDCPTFSIYGQDPVLGNLEDNGGSTFTHALMPASPAIAAGPDSNPMADGRGYVGSTVRDIGSYETGASFPGPCEPYEFVIEDLSDGNMHEVQASELVGAQNIVGGGSKVLFRAKEAIELKQLFQVMQGSTFAIEIGDCISGN